LMLCRLYNVVAHKIWGCLTKSQYREVTTLIVDLEYGVLTL
jgi:hypothetical protein